MTKALRHLIKLIITVSFVFCIFSAFNAPAHAAVGDEAMNSLFKQVTELAENSWLTKAQKICVGLLGFTVVIGFAIGLKDLALSGQISLESILALLVRYVFIIGLLLWLLGQGGPDTGAGLFKKIPDSIAMIGSVISGHKASFDGILTIYGNVMQPLLELWAATWFVQFGRIITLLLVIFFLNVMVFMMAATVLVVQLEMIFIFIGGMFTAALFPIPYFKDLFMGYLKGLATVGVKLLLMSLLLGTMNSIMANLVGSMTAGSEEALVGAAMQISCALVAFYLVLQSIPQYASAIMTGSATSGGGGMVAGAMAAGVGAAMTVVNAAKTGAKSITNAGSTVSQAAQAYQSTSQAALDTGSTPGAARKAGAAAAFKTAMFGAGERGPRGAAERIYADYHRAQEFGRGGDNTMSCGSGKTK